MKKEYKKNKIRVNAPTHIYLSLDFLEGDVNDVIERLKNLIPDHKNFIKNLKEERGFRKDPMWDLINKYEISFDRYSDYTELEIHFFRDETDEELEKRIESDNKKSLSSRNSAIKRKKQKEKEEKELYEKLKLKYG